MTRCVFPSLLTAGLLFVGCGQSDDVATPSATPAPTTSAAPASPSPTEEAAVAPETPASESPAEPEPSELAEKEAGSGEMPREFNGLRKLLAEAKPGGEPKNPQLNAFSNPSRGLRWLARYDDDALVRSFALHALGLYPTEENGSVLLAVATDKKTDATVRASALRGMGRYDLEQPMMASLKEHVMKTADDKNLTLAAGAVDAMHGMVTALPVLEDLVTNPKAAPELKAAAKRALGPQLDNDDLSGPSN